MSFDTIRTAMCELLTDVIGVGQVHNYIRQTRFWDDFFKRTVSDGRVNQWEISRRARAQAISAFDDRTGLEPLFHDTHLIVINGRMSVDDKNASELDFQNILDEFTLSIQKDTTLGGLLILPRELQIPLIEHQMYGGVLTHFARCEFEAIERVGE